LYNWQQTDWSEFRYNLQDIEAQLNSFTEDAAHVSGMLKAMPANMEQEAVIDTMVAEAIKTSEIEGEYLDWQDVVSSIRNNLGLETYRQLKDKKAQGAGELMVAVRNNYTKPLSDNILFNWHKMLFPDQTEITAGAWRTHIAPMQVVSGPIGKEKVHFEAPPSAIVPVEMQRFIKWFNDTAPGGQFHIGKAPVRSAIAHLYFESIHPFEDGNGRIGRAIAEKALSQTLGSPVLLSLSQTIEEDKRSYYSALQNAQASNEITPWTNYFVNVVLTAQKRAVALINFTLKKTRFFDRFKNSINERQQKALNKMLDAGPAGFTGGMTAKKYISITKASKATATRDLAELLHLQALKVEGAGRSTHYSLQLED
jgi:Fic family protein